MPTVMRQSSDLAAGIGSVKAYERKHNAQPSSPGTEQQGVALLQEGMEELADLDRVVQEQREDTSARDMSVSELHIPVPEASAESAMPSAAQWDETESNNIQSIDMDVEPSITPSVLEDLPASNPNMPIDDTEDPLRLSADAPASNPTPEVIQTQSARPKRDKRPRKKTYAEEQYEKDELIKQQTQERRLSGRSAQDVDMRDTNQEEVDAVASDNEFSIVIDVAPPEVTSARKGGRKKNGPAKKAPTMSKKVAEVAEESMIEVEVPAAPNSGSRKSRRKSTVKQFPAESEASNSEREEEEAQPVQAAKISKKRKAEPAPTESGNASSVTVEVPVFKPRTSRSTKTPISQPIEDKEDDVQDEADIPPIEPVKKGRGRPKSKIVEQPAVDATEDIPVAAIVPEPESSASRSTKRKAGRPPKSAAVKSPVEKIKEAKAEEIPQPSGRPSRRATQKSIIEKSGSEDADSTEELPQSSIPSKKPKVANGGKKSNKRKAASLSSENEYEQARKAKPKRAKASPESEPEDELSSDAYDGSDVPETKSKGKAKKGAAKTKPASKAMPKPKPKPKPQSKGKGKQALPNIESSGPPSSQATPQKEPKPDLWRMQAFDEGLVWVFISSVLPTEETQLSQVSDVPSGSQPPASQSFQSQEMRDPEGPGFWWPATIVPNPKSTTVKDPITVSLVIDKAEEVLIYEGEEMVIKKASPATIRTFRASATGVRFAKSSNLVPPQDHAAASSPTPAAGSEQAGLILPKGPSSEAFKYALAMAYQLEAQMEDGLLDADLGSTLDHAKKSSPRKRRIGDALEMANSTLHINAPALGDDDLEEIDDQMTLPEGVLAVSQYKQYFPAWIHRAIPPEPLKPGVKRTAASRRVKYIGYFPWNPVEKETVFTRSQFHTVFDDAFQTCKLGWLETTQAHSDEDLLEIMQLCIPEFQQVVQGKYSPAMELHEQYFEHATNKGRELLSQQSAGIGEYSEDQKIVIVDFLRSWYRGELEDESIPKRGIVDPRLEELNDEFINLYVDAVLSPMAFELLTLEDQPHHKVLATEMHPHDENAALIESHQLARENLKNAGYVARLLAQRDSYKQAQATVGPKKRRRRLDMGDIKRQVVEEKKDVADLVNAV